MIAPLYGLYSRQRTRLEIISDHAALHDLSVRQVEELVKLLPDPAPTATLLAFRRVRVASHG